MHSQEMHTAVISLFIYIHCCSDDFKTSISVGDSVCVCVGCVAASYVNGVQ